MNTSRRSLSVNECKIQASLLLKALHSSDPTTIKQAVKRLQRLPEFSTLSFADIVQMDIKRKHALSVIAQEQGFSSWTHLKTELNFIISGFLNSWFATYEEAKAYQKSEGGFLLPYREQYFVCHEEYIKQLGFDPHDINWNRIKYDWVKPDHKQAWLALNKQWKKILEKKNA